MKKSIFRVAALFCLLITFSITAQAKIDVVDPTNEFFVNDFAGVIADDKQREMQAKGENLYNACKAQVVAVTIDSLDGNNIDDYAITLAREWGIGDEEQDNGILLILSVSDREVKIEVGRGLEGALPDSKAGRILDTYGIGYFSQNDFSSGLAAVYDSLVNEVYIEYGLSPDADYTPIEEGPGLGEAISSIISVVLMLIIFIALSRRGIFIFGGFGGPRGGFGGGGFGGGGGFRGGGGSFGGGGASRRF